MVMVTSWNYFPVGIPKSNSIYAKFRKGGESWDNKAPFGIDKEDSDFSNLQWYVWGRRMEDVRVNCINLNTWILFFHDSSRLASNITSD